MKREAAERIADELDKVREEWLEEAERDHPGFIMTEERRKELGIPDLSDRFREDLVQSLMKHPSKFPEENEDWENERIDP